MGSSLTVSKHPGTPPLLLLLYLLDLHFGNWWCRSPCRREIMAHSELLPARCVIVQRAFPELSGVLVWVGYHDLLTDGHALDSIRATTAQAVIARRMIGNRLRKVHESPLGQAEDWNSKNHDLQQDSICEARAMRCRLCTKEISTSWQNEPLPPTPC